VIGRGWPRAVTADLRRHWRHFAAAALGIVLGTAALAFFLALGLQVRQVLLERVFPSDRIEVAPRSADLDVFAVRIDLGRDALTESDLGELAKIEGVSAVYPKMRLTVPALASGGASLFGAAMQTEIVADGIEPSLVEGEVGPAFHDPADGTDEQPCTADRQCADGAYCDGSWRGGPGLCRAYLPVLVSPYVVELYNGAFRRAYRLPKLNPDALKGLTFEMTFGASTFRSSPRPPIRRLARLVGVSDRAIPLGVTLPLVEVQRLNEALDSKEAGRRFHSAVVEVSSQSAVPRVVEAVEARGLEVLDHGARRAAFGTAVVTAVLGLAAAVLIALSAAHIMHVFSLVVTLRRHEIGVLRAVGARRSDIRTLLVTEAALVGALAGAAGVTAALAGAAIADRLAAAHIPDFPFKPDSLFAFSPLLVLAVVALAVAACVVGVVPAVSRAIAGDPSDALAGR
jgi:putative ABC transport system permease protein